jgi:drug/metabolite transporter (DMT)-like permease
MSIVVHLVLGSIQLCYSGWHLVSTVASKSGANPYVFASYRSICTLLLMFIFVKIRNKTISIDQKDWVTIFLMGVCSFVNSVFTILALQHIRPVHYSIFQPCIPAVATIISILYGIEKLAILKTLGIVCAIGGAVVSKYHPPTEDDGIEVDSDSVTFGTILVVIQVGCMGLLLVLQKTLLNRYDSTVITIGVSIFAVISGNDPASITDLLTFRGLPGPRWALLYAAFSTFYTNNAYAWAGKQVSPSVTAIYNTFQPVFTALLSVLFLHEVLSVFELAGSALVILGMVVTLYGRQLELNDLNNITSLKKES